MERNQLGKKRRQALKLSLSASTVLGSSGMSQTVESRMGAVAWAIRQRSVSHPRSSNRTCPIKASGSPTGFTVRHTGSKPTARGFCTVITLLRPRHSSLGRRLSLMCSRLITNHHDLAILESVPEVRALSSAGITRIRRSYDPVRLPPWPPPVATLRPLPSPVTGLPRLLGSPFRRAVPTTPADQAGARVDCFPAHAAFPKCQEGIRIVTFEMLWGERRGQWHHRRSSESMERPMQKLNDLSRSLTPLNPDGTLIAVIEMSQSSWLVAGIVPGIERHPLKKLEPNEGELLRLLMRWRAEACQSAPKFD